MNKKKSYTALRRKYSQIRKVEDCAIKDRYENQIITRDPLFHGKERLPNMQSITDFRVVNEVKPDDQTEFPPVPQDVYSSLHLMRYYPVNAPNSSQKGEKRLSARGKNLESSDQKSSAKKGQQPIKAYTVENVDIQPNSVEKINTELNELFINDTEQSEISEGHSMRKSHLSTSSKVLNRKLLSEKKPTRTCKDKKHMKPTEAFTRSTLKFQQEDHEDSPIKRLSTPGRNAEDNKAPPVIISPTKRKQMERNPYTLLRVQSQQMARKNTSQMKSQEDYINYGRETENVIVTPVKTYGGKKESSKLLSSMNLQGSIMKKDSQATQGSARPSIKNKEVTLKKSEIRELTRKITEMMQSKGEQVANKEVNYQDKKISLDKFVDICNKHFSHCDHTHEVEAQL